MAKDAQQPNSADTDWCAAPGIFTQLGVIASTLVSDRLHQVEVVQVGATAPSGALVASHLTQLLLTRHAEAVSVVFRGYARSDGPSMTEVFATESMPSSR